jgi:hypothetical protein
MTNDTPTTRRGFLNTAGTALAAVGGAAILVRSGPAQAQKAPKKSVQYQSEPKTSGGQAQKCANCQFYQEPGSGSEMGNCQLVAGKISPNGWCNLWAAAG